MYEGDIQETSYLQRKSKVHPKDQEKRYAYNTAKARPRSNLKRSSWAPAHGPDMWGVWRFQVRLVRAIKAYWGIQGPSCRRR